MNDRPQVVNVGKIDVSCIGYVAMVVNVVAFFACYLLQLAMEEQTLAVSAT